MSASIRQSSAAAGAGRPHLTGDAERLWDVLANGGIAIVPGFSTYGLWGSSKEANLRIIETKRRGKHKRSGLLMCAEAERDIHVADPRSRNIIDCITQDYDLPLSVIARYRSDHPLVRTIDLEFLPYCTAGGTMSTGLNAGPFHEAIGRMSLQRLVPVFGSSANISGTGAKPRVEDIEPEILAIADLVLDYGLCRYHAGRVASTQINFESMRVTRTGACYEVIADILHSRFGWDVPSDPGRESSPDGPVDEYALLASDDASGA